MQEWWLSTELWRTSFSAATAFKAVASENDVRHRSVPFRSWVIIPVTRISAVELLRTNYSLRTVGCLLYDIYLICTDITWILIDFICANYRYVLHQAIRFRGVAVFWAFHLAALAPLFCISLLFYPQLVNLIVGYKTFVTFETVGLNHCQDVDYGLNRQFWLHTLQL